MKRKGENGSYRCRQEKVIIIYFLYTLYGNKFKYIKKHVNPRNVEFI